MTYNRTVIALVLFVCTVDAQSTEAGKKVYVGQRVAGQISFDQVDHAPWNALLSKYVDSDGYVNYSKWHSSADDRRLLLQYLNSLSLASPQSGGSRDAKLAFWINAYNAVTLEGILRVYPTTSIRNHTAKVLGYNIWHDLQLYVSGTPYSLDAIEHQILRKQGDPRIHFAIVCASIGCPRLLNEAYTAKDVQNQLDVNARDFFSRKQNFRYDQRSQTFQLSAILQWFGDDFGPDQPAQLKRIARWLPPAAQAAAQSGRVRVSYVDYNWNLNDSKGRR